MIRSVILVPDPCLKQPCAPVEEFDGALHELIHDLEETRQASPSCVGIAACQIGVLQRVAIVDTSCHKKYGEQSQGHLVLINPRIVAHEGERFGREGCLSIPDFTANVRRAHAVMVEFQDKAGNLQQIRAEDFEAVVLQHEIDHLDGILFLDRVANLKTDVFPRKKK